MKKKVIKLTEDQYEALKNILVWAELYDVTRNNDKNKEVFDKIRFIYIENNHEPKI